MDRPPRPLWRLLILTTVSSDGVSLTCDECFTLLEYLADEAVQGIDMESLYQALDRHMKCCPDCWAHHRARIRWLESGLGPNRTAPPGG